ncbi:MAG: fused MFS/spermidine synthase [Alphaproteobacteria bacterium]|nr:fused MFS/spermidine synthase [Alphaproteobacteria bacterium]
MKKLLKKLDNTTLLFAIIILEGYVVLSCEMLAIRQTVPFVGSGTDTVSIIIAAVLMPLAFGYYAGGRFNPGKKPEQAIREKLTFNIVISQAILMIGLSYYPLVMFFQALLSLGIDNRLVLTAIYSLLFLVTPVYLLGQTIPLVSNFFTKKKLSEITGRMLFFSTIGSFFGAVFSTLILMSTIGVHYTVALLIALMTILLFLLGKNLRSETMLYSIPLALFGIVLNSGYVMNAFGIVSDNQYNTVMVYEDMKGNRYMSLNHTDSSMYNDKGGKHPYVEFAEDVAIDPIRNGDRPRDILVIGAGAFTFGFEDHYNNYDFVDIDGSLKQIAEEYILRKRLTANKHFEPMEVRAYFAKTEKKYDVIFLDAYLGDLTIPEHLVTREFFVSVRDHLKKDGLVLANFVLSPNFLTPFSRNIDNTLRSVFPHVSRHVVGGNYNLWNKNPAYVNNIIYMYRDTPKADSEKIYTDNKNTIWIDKPHQKPGWEKM